MSDAASTLDALGLEPITNRRVYVLKLDKLTDLPDSFAAVGPRFVLLLLADFSELPGQLTAIAKKLVDAGCAYLCIWGPGCELMHDEMDEARLKAPQVVGDEDSVLMTTDHADDSIEDAVEFALLRASPAGMYERGCGATVLAVQNRQNWIGEVERTARRLLATHAI
jgi:hypothetical protein